MPIAVRHSIRRPFVPLGANLSRHLNLNQFLRKKADCLAEKINISSTLVKKLLKCDLMSVAMIRSSSARTGPTRMEPNRGHSCQEGTTFSGIYTTTYS